MSVTPTEIAVSNHALGRYVERVEGAPNLRALLNEGPYGEREDVCNAARGHFKESLPCSLMATPALENKWTGERHSRINPHDHMVWVYADSFDDKDHTYKRWLVTTFPYIPHVDRHIVLGNMLACGVCDRLYHPDDFCPFCGADAVGYGMDADRSIGRWYDSTDQYSIGAFGRQGLSALHAELRGKN